MLSSLLQQVMLLLISYLLWEQHWTSVKIEGKIMYVIIDLLKHKESCYFKTFQSKSTLTNIQLIDNNLLYWITDINTWVLWRATFEMLLLDSPQTSSMTSHLKLLNLKSRCFYFEVSRWARPVCVGVGVTVVVWCQLSVWPVQPEKHSSFMWLSSTLINNQYTLIHYQYTLIRSLTGCSVSIWTSYFKDSTDLYVIILIIIL